MAMIDLTRASRSNLRQGAVYMLVGLLWGFLVPASLFPRLALGAHIQLTAHGVMFLVAGLVLQHLRSPKGSMMEKILIAAPWLTWPVMLTEMANGWWGASKTLPIAAGQAGATGSQPWQENIIAATHLVGGIVLIAYWSVIAAALFRAPLADEKSAVHSPD
jgi:hydroxylaminobenzene mutase